ncbi:hypothetical protein E0H86_00960 [Acinetobacter sp. ANC 4635]|uniref:nSTAND3 domain-containing NTPase n=1 Tax=Acinetobacter sp. ANC 4635 TaxID=2529846 RepID=UPI00103F3D2E|nr:hypothetical protein [Acinetobacter sp. ANC 4635]TCB33244.1 hypothetical protein E0H86_00960 [Acinetobacter sp. ANC 4635]
MDIETTGVKKYAFQDLVCISLLLNIQNIENLNFFVEPENSEDAKITIDNIDGINEIEIQVKGSQDSVTPTNLAQHLAHFPKGKAENCLYDRLINNSNLLVVFVMTGRCNDATSPFLSNLDNFYLQHKSSKIKKEHAEAIRNEFKNIEADPEESDLKINRSTYINGLYKKYGILKVRKAFERLVIIEQVNDSNLLKTCYELLRTKYSIPDDIHQSVIERLKTVIFDGKDTKENIVGIFKNELSNFIPQNIYPIDYVEHGNEDDLKQILSTKNALLITGSPRIGKTYISRWIAAEYTKLGFEIKETSDVAEALRFITEPTNSKRLVLIDDPFGAAHSIPNALNSFQQFKVILSRLSSNKKLITAQVQDRLLEVAAVENTEEATIGIHHWLNLNDTNPIFLNNLWNSLANKYSVSRELQNIVSTNLKNNKLLLEAGCLEYLAVHHSELKNNFNLENIKRLSHQDARNLGNALDEDGYKFILRVLAIATNHSKDISIPDLTYILYEKNVQNILSISDFMGTSVLLNTIEPIDYTDKILINYDPEYKIADSDDRLIEKLEFRKILNIKNSKNIIFSHPFYRSAAEYLVQKNSTRKEHEIIDLVSKGIFCLSSKTSRATARNLDWIFYSLKESDNQKALVELAIKALKSSFPSTRDIAFQFLINNYRNLPTDIEKKIDIWSYHVSNSDLLDNAVWVKGEPIYPMGSDITLESSLATYFDSFSIKSYSPELDPFFMGNNTVTSKEAWDFLQVIEKSPENLTLYAISKLLSYDEALIRSKAINIWLKVPRDDDENLLEQVFLEIHPAIAKNALESIIKVWNDCDKKRQELLLNGLIRLASHPANACQMIEDIVIFNRNQKVKNLPWIIFGTILSTLLDSIPDNIYISDHRLYNIVDTSINYLETPMLISIINSWFNWLEKQVTIKLPTDYAFGITTILVKATINQPELRFNLIKKLLNLHGTGAAVRVIYDLVGEWDNLMQEEKVIIISKLNEERVDKYWLQSAALIQNDIPEELQQLLLPKDVSLENESLVTLNEKNNGLFLAAVQMYLGNPQPLWYLGVHHRGKKYWKPVVEKLTQNSSHPLFNKAWDEIYSYGDDNYVVPFINQLDPTDVEKVFEILFEIKINTTDNFMPKTWDALFSKIEDPVVKSKWIERIASHSINILDDFSQLKYWIINPEIRSEFWRYLKNDENLIITSYSFIECYEAFDENHRSAMVLILLDLFRKSPPTHPSTCEILKNRIQQINADSAIINEINNYRSGLFEKMKSEKYNKINRENIKNWID